MRGKGKVMGLALIAVLALSAIGAQGAAGHEFKSDVANTVITGHSESNEAFTTNTGAAFTCTVSYRGEILGATEADTITLVPKLENCTFAGSAATVTVKDCAYIFDSDTNANGHADMDIECAEGGQIEIATSACTLDIRAQTGIQDGVHYFNETSAKAVTVDTTVKNLIVAQKTGSPILCAFAGTTATINGSFTMEGFEFKSNSGTTTTPNYVEGNKVGISVVGADSKP